MRLKDKIAIVTGAGSGFGEGIARRFAAEGAKVVLADINDEGGRRVSGAIAASGAAAHYVHADVSVAGEVAAMVAAAVERFGGLDIIVNNAGMPQRNGPMLGVDEATFDRIFAVNVKSIYLMGQALIPQFRRQGGGVIVNIGSTAGIRPRPGLIWYNASKGAVNLVTKAMAIELAPDKIRVTCIAPVAGETPLLASFMGEDTPEKRAQFRASIPLGRLSLPQDIADAALFLASDEAQMVTGAVLEVDGGRCI